MGAGAVGTYVGGLLASRGFEVVFVGRERSKAEAENGIVLEDLDGSRIDVPRASFRCETAPDALAGSDVILVGVKSGATAQTAVALAPIARAGAIVVSLQNGMNNARILRERLGGREVLASIVSFNVRPLGDGVFRRATTGPLVIEHSDDPRVAALAKGARDAGLEVELRAGIEAMQWAKLVMNLNNAVSALSGAPTPQLLFEPGYRRVLAAIVGEAIDVFRRAGVRPDRLGAIPVGWFPSLLRLPTPLLRVVARAQLRIDPEARSSMWEDLVRGRATEVDELNGEIVRLAAANGIAAPINERVVRAVHDAERAGKGSPNLSPAQLQQLLGV
jgi:2-dehydropantoate 2-reductase